MSTVKTNNLQAVTGGALAPIADIVNGTARAWVNFNGTGTVAIAAQYNVASITDNGAGDYTVNFTAALADANYGLAGNVESTGGSQALALYAAAGLGSVPALKTASQCRVVTGAPTDAYSISIAFNR